ncbi:hypothetical protein, partial [Bacteroides fragilis]|uniref:hypothetical protein n=1 Tax=Bacteroides fragilis TaxID=817 RepID=UPI001E5F18F7
FVCCTGSHKIELTVQKRLLSLKKQDDGWLTTEINLVPFLSVKFLTALLFIQKLFYFQELILSNGCKALKTQSN